MCAWTHDHRQGGFSLVEVMCAVLILGIALVGLTQALTTALSSTKESEVQTAAALLAAGRIETLRADGFLIDGETEGEGDEGLSLYRWRESVSSTSIDGLHEVAVVVESSRTGKKIYELRTLLFDPPIVSTSEESKTSKDSTKSRREGRKQ
jgi:prepilin-type N-terminal cleavage/methylation domain-containing protein